jgi:hypothetical protein
VVRLRREGKTYREIAEEVRISFSQIKAILDKYGADDDDIFEYHNDNVKEEDDTNTHYIPISSKAYKLFSEGKTPLQVCIALNLRAPEVQILYKEYWELRRMYSLVRTYDELGDRGISNLLQLYQSCKVQQISTEQVMEYLTIYGNDLSLVKRQYNEIDIRFQILLSQKTQTENELRDLHTAIGFSSDKLKSIQAQCAEAEKERSNLLKQKVALHIFISQFRNNNDAYVRLERFVQEKVNTLLRNNMKLLELSLVSALRTFRNDPNMYRYLLQKSELTAKQLQKSNTTLLVPANNTSVSYSYFHGLQYHTQKQKPDDFCYSCYDASYDAEGISREYFEDLGKEITREIGLDSLNGMYAASHHGRIS